MEQKYHMWYCSHIVCVGLNAHINSVRSELSNLAGWLNMSVALSPNPRGHDPRTQISVTLHIFIEDIWPKPSKFGHWLVTVRRWILLEAHLTHSQYKARVRGCCEGVSSPSKMPLILVPCTTNCCHVTVSKIHFANMNWFSRFFHRQFGKENCNVVT